MHLKADWTAVPARSLHFQAMHKTCDFTFSAVFYWLLVISCNGPRAVALFDAVVEV
jgi:hypothetical protein